MSRSAAALDNEFIMRTGKREDVAGWIEDIVAGLLDRTKEDHPAWSAAHYERLVESSAG